MAREDYYSILGVDRQAPEREIKRAYYGLARDLHPDKAKTPEEGRINAEKLAVISKAYNTLKDPVKRTEYDSSNPRGAGAAQAPAAAPAPPAAPSAPRPAAPKIPGGAPPQTAAQGSQSTTGGSQKLSASDMAGAKIVMAQKAFVKGMEHFKTAEYKKALPFFEAAVTNDPESEPHYHMKLAICLMKSKGSFTRAEEAARRASEMDTYNIDFKLQLGEIYETVGSSSKALTVYEDVLKWEPDNTRAKGRISALKTAHAQANPSVLAKLLPSIFGKK